MLVFPAIKSPNELENSLTVVCHDASMIPPRSLTSVVVWKNAQSQLISFMENAKRERLRSERIEVLEDRLSILKTFIDKYRQTRPTGDIPSTSTIVLQIPEIRQIFEAPNDVGGTADALESLNPNFPDLIDRWREAANTQLDEYVGQALQLPKAAASFLAIAVFYHCRRCEETVDRQNVLSHSCLIYVMEREEEKTTLDPLNYVFRHHYAFNAADFFVEGDFVKPVVVVSGEDPLKATAESMDRLDLKFTCSKSCCIASGARNIMSWRTAVSFRINTLGTTSAMRLKALHSLETATVPPSEDQWSLATAVDKELAAQLENAVAKIHPRTWGNNWYSWRCLKCPHTGKESTRGSHLEIIEHLSIRYCANSLPEL